MFWRAAAILLTILCLCRSAPVAAEEAGRVCFDPGTTRPSPEGYIEIRRIAAAVAAGSGPMHIILRRPPGSGDIRVLNTRRLFETQLEFSREGVGFGRMTVLDGEAASGDCLILEIDRTGAHTGMWHYWGPYFAVGDDTVSPDQRESMRAIVADYRPGETKYCIEAHTDTVGSVEANMDLSRRRAENIALELVRQGVRWEDMQVRWYGETRLARPTADGVAEPLNRRSFVDVRRACRTAR